MKKKKPIIAIKADKNSKPIVFTGDKPNKSIREILDKFNEEQKKLREALRTLDISVYKQRDGTEVLVSTKELKEIISKKE